MPDDDEKTNNFMKPPKPLLVDNGNMANKWKLWLQRYEWFEIATKLNKQPDEIQVATFMGSIGEDAVTIFNTFKLTADQLKKVKNIKDEYTNHFTPKVNLTYERYLLHKIVQANGESFDEFLTRIRSQSNKCEFGDLQDSLVLDQIVVGTLSDKLREKLLCEDDLKLDKAIKMCKASEISSKQIQDLQKEDTSSINSVKSSVSKSSSKSTKFDKSVEDHFHCWRCDQTHGKRACPAFNKTCEKCKKKGHFTSVCSRKVKKVEVVNESTDEEEVLFVDSISTTVKDDSKSWFEEIMLDKVVVKVKLDTGGQCNVIPLSIARKIGKTLRKSRTACIVSYSGDRIKVEGELTLWTTVRNKKFTMRFIVIDREVTPILGKADCEASGLIIRVKEVKSEVRSTKSLQGLGQLKNFEYDIDIIDNPKFEIFAARRIPYSMRELVKKRLDSMEKNNIIKRQTEATPVVSPMIAVKQKGDIRICLDPTELNKNIIRRQFPMRTIEEIATRIKKSKFFTKLDCKKGFWQIKVSQRSQKYLTFATPWGRYSYLVLPFGLSSAPELFQQIMSDLLSDLDQVEVSMDDILIHAETIEQLKLIQDEVTKRIKNAGLTLNDEKCEYGKERIRFLGHILSAKGLEADDSKVITIDSLKMPTNKTELQRFLGMVTYLSKFIPNMSERTQPLRKLLEKGVVWDWQIEQTTAFGVLKTLLKSTPVLKFYDVNEEVTIQADASSYALGAVLLQNDHPVAYASKALSKSEQRYPQIEKEALALRFGCQRFHEYIYGKKVILETDHKPLESIFKKPIFAAPPRLQRILMSTLIYSPTIKYKKGGIMYIADTLSRDCSNEEEPESNELEVLTMIPMSEDAVSRFEKSTLRDPELVQLRKIVADGWPNDRETVPENLKKYWNFREEISFVDGLLFKGQKVIIPSEQKLFIMEKVHHGHFGIERTISLAREYFYWYGMTTDLSEFVERCKVCQKHQKSNAKEPMIVKPVPSKPWEIIASDIFTFVRNEYLLIVDSYSGFFDIQKLHHNTSKEVISILKSWFSLHGVPKILESDNGPHYSSALFKEFANQWNFKHKTSSPKFPQSNGLAERFVQTAKNMLHKCSMDGTDINLAMLNYRNTPRNENLGSPSQRLMSRTLRPPFTINDNKLKPKVVKDVESKLQALRDRQKVYFDRSTKAAPEIKVGDDVRLKIGKRNWTGAKIISNTDKPRSVMVETDGKVYRRNTSFIRPTAAIIKEPLVLTPNVSDDRVQHPNEVPINGPMQGNSNTNGNFDVGNHNVYRTRSGREVRPVQRLNL